MILSRSAASTRSCACGSEESEPTEPVIELDVLVEDDTVGVVTGSVDYPGHQLYRNMWEIHFAEDGRARRFVEWYMKAQKPE